MKSPLPTLRSSPQWHDSVVHLIHQAGHWSSSSWPAAPSVSIIYMFSLFTFFSLHLGSLVYSVLIRITRDPEQGSTYLGEKGMVKDYRHEYTVVHCTWCHWTCWLWTAGSGASHLQDLVVIRCLLLCSRIMPSYFTILSVMTEVLFNYYGTYQGIKHRNHCSAHCCRGGRPPN